MSELPDNWDDLRFLLAVARAGTFAGAARALGVTHTTVARRISELQARVGSRLLERPDGAKGPYAPTRCGESLVATAASIEESLLALDLNLFGEDSSLEGTLLVTSVEPVSSLVAGQLESFTRLYPNIVVELSSSKRSLSLAKRESDVAVRVENTPTSSLVGCKLGVMAFAPYASEALAEQPLQSMPWLGWMNCFAEPLFPDWLAQHAPGARVVARLDDFSSMVEAMAAHAGAAMLPCIIGDRDPRLVRVGLRAQTWSRAIWLLSHPEVRSASRVEVFFRHIKRGFVGLKAALMGDVEPVLHAPASLRKVL